MNDRGKPIKGSRIAVMGVAYKRDVDDCRESPGLELMELLADKGADVSFHDPHIPRLPTSVTIPELTGRASQPLTREYLAGQDRVLVATDHTAFDWPWVVEDASSLSTPGTRPRE